MNKESFNIKKNIIEKAFKEKEQTLKEEIEILTEEEPSETPNKPLENEILENKQPQTYIHKSKLKKSAKIALFLLILIVLIFILLILFNKNYINNKNIIIKKSFKTFGNEILNIIDLPKNSTRLGENFTIKSNVKTSLSSEVVNNNYKTNDLYKGYYNYLNNINNLDTTLVIKHDIKNKMFAYNRQSKLNDNLIINDKYIIKDSTEYFYEKNFENTYINNGNNNYFESFTKEDNNYSNIKYIYKFILNAFSDNIEKSKIKKTTEKVEDEKLKKYSINLSKKDLINISNKVLDNLKDDPKASKILNALIENFSSKKIDNKNKILNYYDNIIINIYTKGLTNRPSKFEIILEKDNLSKSIIFDISLNKIYYLINDNTKYTINYHKDKNNLTIDILDGSNKSIGKIRKIKNKNDKTFKLSLKDKAINLNIDINSKDTKIEKSSYKNTISIKVDYEEDNQNILKGKIQISSYVKDTVKIDDEIHDIYFTSSLTNEEKERITNLYKNRLKKSIAIEQGD